MLRVTAARASLGGAANVAHNVAALGARAILVGVIGTGAEIERLCATVGDNIDARLFATPHQPTTVKTRFIARGTHQLLRVDDETADPLDEESAAEVRRLKGSDRPIQSDAARATVMSSLASVDLVVLFAEDTPLSLIDAMRPEVLAKGADYRPEQVDGADIVRRYGGKVLLVDLLPSQGTTATIARVRERMARVG